MNIIYVLTKNGVMITRAFKNVSNAMNDCRDKNARAPQGIKYSFVKVVIADT